jgi:hypothetical protein
MAVAQTRATVPMIKESPAAQRDLVNDLDRHIGQKRGLELRRCVAASSLLLAVGVIVPQLLIDFLSGPAHEVSTNFPRAFVSQYLPHPALSFPGFCVSAGADQAAKACAAATTMHGSEGSAGRCPLSPPLQTPARAVSASFVVFGTDCPAIKLREHLRCTSCRGRTAKLDETAR